MTSLQPVHIAFCVDNQFCLPLGVLIQSLVEHSQRPLSLHIVSAGLDNTHVEKLASYADKRVSVSFYAINDTSLSELHIDKGFSERLSVATYYRFLLPDLLPSSVEKLLFLDADMLCMGGIDTLYDLPLDGALSLVVEDVKLTESLRWDVLKLARPHYFNAGLMLMDLKKWREQEAAKQCFALLEQQPVWEYNDQDVLNIVLNERVKFIDSSWNLQSHGLAGRDVKQQGIIHFTGAEKPWQHSCIHPFTEAFRIVLKRSEYRQTPLQHYLDSHDKKAIERLLAHGVDNVSLLIYGCGQRGRRLYSYLKEHHPDIAVKGFIDRSPPDCEIEVPVYQSWPGDTHQAIFIGSEAFRDEITASLLQQGAHARQII